MVTAPTRLVAAWYVDIALKSTCFSVLLAVFSHQGYSKCCQSADQVLPVGAEWTSLRIQRGTQTQSTGIASQAKPVTLGSREGRAFPSTPAKESCVTGVFYQDPGTPLPGHAVHGHNNIISCCRPRQVSDLWAQEGSHLPVLPAPLHAPA